MGSVVVVVRSERVDAVRVIVADGVVPVIKIPSRRVVDKTVVVVIYVITGDFSWVDPDICGKVGVVYINSGIDHCNHDFARGGEHTRIKSPGFRDVHVDIRGA